MRKSSVHNPLPRIWNVRGVIVQPRYVSEVAVGDGERLILDSLEQKKSGIGAAAPSRS